MRPYLGQNVRIKWTEIFVGGENTYNPDRIEQMESIAHLWGDGDIRICSANVTDRQIVAEHFQLILNSPSVLKCQNLKMSNANFSFKDYKVLYSVKVFEIDYRIGEVDTNYWFQFIEQPGAKPVVVFGLLHRESIDNLLKQLSKVIF
ncbi:hypothetical protein DdX_20515 [Ditylenchus destructor]|uniref:Uncharacterized protein n=1 Tax=Ditylenchus destructor TaxID=166010 RepID=A0AAD4MHY1_9BILA|nr:hypothetical protein DdX_20515 [Ditylenchus destructor]